MSAFKKTTRLAGITGLVVGAGILVAGPASAHVTITPGEGHAGEYTVATIAVPHGCDGSSTTKVAIEIPDELNAVTPTINPGWTVEKKMEKLATPIEDSHGNEVTERVSQIIYTAKTPLPDDIRDAFDLSFQVPDVAGKTIYFPSIQTCEQGETAWVEIAEEGGDEPEHPSPTYAVLEGSDDGHGHGHDSDDEDAAATEEAADAKDTATSEDDDSNALGIAGLVAGLLGLGLGGAAFANSRRKA